MPDAQRERGEIAIEGVGTLELDARPERDGMHRIDVRELNARCSRSHGCRCSRHSAISAAPPRRPGLALDVKRFADAGVLAAVADRAVATTLVTRKGGR